VPATEAGYSLFPLLMSAGRSRVSSTCRVLIMLPARSQTIQSARDLLIAHLLSRDYIGSLKPQDPDQLGSASLLLFGPAGEISAELAPLIGSYRLPPHADGNVALSFGVGASGSGVPFHVHGHGWAESIHGAKVLMVVCEND